MKLYVLRHGIAVDRGTPGYERDAGRCLTPEGQEKMEQAARGMAALGLEFDLILTSPYVRARETAEIVARVLGLGAKARNGTASVPYEVCDALVPGGSRKDLFKRLKECAADSQVVVVGHEPDLSELIGELIAGDPNTALDLKKGSLAALSFDRPTRPETAFLEWLLTPRQLRMLGGVIRDT
jgi:phosphohistidine phosphatase